MILGGRDGDFKEGVHCYWRVEINNLRFLKLSAMVSCLKCQLYEILMLIDYVVNY